MTVRYWETRNDANHNNRHAEVLGFQFFAFPYQSFLVENCIGNFGATIGDFYGLKGRIWSATIYIRDGKKEPGHEQRHFRDRNEAFEWAAQKLIDLGCTPHEG